MQKKPLWRHKSEAHRLSDNENHRKWRLANLEVARAGYRDAYRRRRERMKLAKEQQNVESLHSVKLAAHDEWMELGEKWHTVHFHARWLKHIRAEIVDRQPDP